MKFLITFIVSFIFIQYSYPQGEEEYPDNELTIQVQNAPNRTIIFEFIPIGTNWAVSTGCNFHLYNDVTTYYKHT